MEGHGFYNQHSTQQRGAAAPGIELLRQAAREVRLAGDGSVTIADYGSSEGRNALAPLSAALDEFGRRSNRPVAVVAHGPPRQRLLVAVRARGVGSGLVPATGRVHVRRRSILLRADLSGRHGHARVVGDRCSVAAGGAVRARSAPVLVARRPGPMPESGRPRRRRTGKRSCAIVVSSCATARRSSCRR